MKYGTIDRAYAMQLATCPADLDGPILMVNFMRYHEVADYGPDTDASFSGREADDRYAPVEVLGSLGAKVVFFGDVVSTTGAEQGWHRVGIVNYPTRRSFIEMQSRPDFQAKHVHKEAGMASTIVMGTIPVPDQPEAAERGDLVRFTVLPPGPDTPATPASSHVLAVEGTIVGDGRSWATLVVDWAPAVVAAPLGAMVVDVRPTGDSLARTIATWHKH
jgi:hypothetical protein